MDSIIIEGGKRLQGTVSISGAKNAALPLLAATLLTQGRSVLENVPQLQDIHTMVGLLQQLGCEIEHDGDRIAVTTAISKEAPPTASYDLVKTMRASVLVLGPLIAHYKSAKVSLPGGCAIGARPINQHLQALSLLGAQVSLNHGYIEAKAKQLRGAKIIFDTPTVTGTENTMMAASLAQGESLLENAACEPEIKELANFLNAMGAKIEGAGTTKIHIQGVPTLHPTTHRIIPDRIEAGTFMIAAAITGGELILQNVEVDHLDAVLAKLATANIQVTAQNGNLHVQSNGDLHPLDITTQPYPGFPTDLQPQFMVLATCANGQSTIRERVFEDRFKHIPELNRMGASITNEGQTAVIQGNTNLAGTTVMATDLRAGAALVLAGLTASGTTVISRIYHIDRGYEQFEKKLANIGAVIRRKQN